MFSTALYNSASSFLARTTPTALSKGEENGREVVLAFSSKKMLEDRDVGAILSFWPSVWRCSDILRTGQHL